MSATPRSAILAAFLGLARGCRRLLHGPIPACETVHDGNPIAAMTVPGRRPFGMFPDLAALAMATDA
jgi:hypothetical protein